MKIYATNLNNAETFHLVLASLCVNYNVFIPYVLIKSVNSLCANLPVVFVIQ